MTAALKTVEPFLLGLLGALCWFLQRWNEGPALIVAAILTVLGIAGVAAHAIASRLDLHEHPDAGALVFFGPWFTYAAVAVGFGWVTAWGAQAVSKDLADTIQGGVATLLIGFIGSLIKAAGDASKPLRPADFTRDAFPKLYKPKFPTIDGGDNSTAYYNAYRAVFNTPAVLEGGASTINGWGLDDRRKRLAVIATGWDHAQR